MIFQDIVVNETVYNIKIGENAKDNDTIVKTSNQKDWWFHLDGVSGPHIVIQDCELNKTVFNIVREVMTEYKNNIPPRSSIIYTNIKNVKRTNQPGRVLLTHFKTFKH
jgi:predicted ribosome quality control (RQC) complex YloA/Tae2 family protein